MKLTQSPDKIVFGRENGRGQYQRHQYLTGGKAAADQHMAQEAAAAVLIVDLDFKGGEQSPDIPDNGVRRLVLDETVIHRHNFVGALLVDAGDNPAVPQPAGKLRGSCCGNDRDSPYRQRPSRDRDPGEAVLLYLS